MAATREPDRTLGPLMSEDARNAQRRSADGAAAAKAEADERRARDDRLRYAKELQRIAEQDLAGEEQRQFRQEYERNSPQPGIDSTHAPRSRYAWPPAHTDYDDR
jgi:hypothetical protein